MPFPELMSTNSTSINCASQHQLLITVTPDHVHSLFRSAHTSSHHSVTHQQIDHIKSLSSRPSPYLFSVHIACQLAVLPASNCSTCSLLLCLRIAIVLLAPIASPPLFVVCFVWSLRSVERMLWVCHSASLEQHCLILQLVLLRHQ